MKTKHIVLALTAAAVAAVPANAEKDYESTLRAVKVSNTNIRKAKDVMHVSFDLDLSDVDINKNQQIIYTPVYSGGGDSLVLDKIVLNGRNVAIKELREPSRRVVGASDVIERRKGAAQTVSVSRSFPYSAWMEYSTLSLAEDLCGCGQLQDQDRIPLGDFDNRPAPAPLVTFVTPKAEAVKARDEKGSAFVDYVVNKTNILPDYRGNRKEIAKIISTIDLVKNDPNVSITQINIHGYASPEGTYANNTRLAEGRAASLKEYVSNLYDIPEKVFSSNATPEDWEGLRRLVVASTLPEREEILEIIDRPNMDPDARDHEIRKRFPKTYAFILKEWYPGLRHSDYTVSYIVRPFTVEETKEIMFRNPKQVSLNEMFLVAQTLTPGSEEFNKVMDIAVNTFPDDATANLNAACAAISAGDYTKAESYLSKAGDSPEADEARAAVAMNRGELDKAEILLFKAKDAGVESADENLRILARMRELKAQNE